MYCSVVPYLTLHKDHLKERRDRGRRYGSENACQPNSHTNLTAIEITYNEHFPAFPKSTTNTCPTVQLLCYTSHLRGKLLRRCPARKESVQLLPCVRTTQPPSTTATGSFLYFITAHRCAMALPQSCVCVPEVQTAYISAFSVASTKSSLMVMGSDSNRQLDTHACHPKTATEPLAGLKHLIK